MTDKNENNVTKWMMDRIDALESEIQQYKNALVEVTGNSCDDVLCDAKYIAKHALIKKEDE